MSAKVGSCYINVWGGGGVTTGRVLVLIQVGSASPRRAKHTPTTWPDDKGKRKQAEKLYKTSWKQSRRKRALALNRLPTALFSFGIFCFSCSVFVCGKFTPNYLCFAILSWGVRLSWTRKANFFCFPLLGLSLFCQWWDFHHFLPLFNNSVVGRVLVLIRVLFHNTLKIKNQLLIQPLHVLFWIV